MGPEETTQRTSAGALAISEGTEGGARPAGPLRCTEVSDSCEVSGLLPRMAWVAMAAPPLSLELGAPPLQGRTCTPKKRATTIVSSLPLIGPGQMLHTHTCDPH